MFHRLAEWIEKGSVALNYGGGIEAKGIVIDLVPLKPLLPLITLIPF
ncbi:hypothetical protein ACIO52_02670 [Nocardia sp. NPDC087230]